MIVGMISPFTLKHKMVEVGRWMYERSYVVGTEGNISCRLRGGNVLITPSGLCKGRLSEEDLVTIDMEGRKSAGKHEVSSEYRLHLYIYSVRDDVESIVHAHPMYATSFACAGKPLAAKVLPEVIQSLGEIPLAPYATPSTPELHESLSGLVRNHDAILLANHGLVVLGSDPEDAFNKLEMVEQFARIMHTVESLGGVHELTREQVTLLRGLRSQGPRSDSSVETEKSRRRED